MLKKLGLPFVIILIANFYVPSSFAIIGGSNVASGDEAEKYLAGLIVLKTDDSATTCSAVVIAPQILLTAAHCFDDAKSIIVNFALNIIEDPPDGSLLRKATKSDVKIHPDYDPKAENGHDDLALVHFQGPLPKGKEMAKLFFAKTLSKGQDLILYGYGAKALKAGLSSGEGPLQKTTVKIT